jgi:PKD repeat protein
MKKLLLGVLLMVGMLGLSVQPVSTAAGDTTAMNDRDALMGVPVVVWGNTKHPNGTAFTLDFGDLSAPVGGTVLDQTYIFAVHTYATAGVYTVTLTVGGDSDTATVQVFDAGALTAENLRGIQINLAIEDGLRYLYTQQDNRTTTYMTPFTTWEQGGHGWDPEFYLSYTSLVVLAFENHGHSVLDNPMQDIYQPVVQRGLNSIFDYVTTISLGVQATSNSSNDPCVGTGIEAAPCMGLGSAPINSHSMYSSAVMALAVAGSGAPANTVAAGVGAGSAGYITGRSYAEVIQRMANTIAWGMNDGSADVANATCFGPPTEDCRGGFSYRLNNVGFGFQLSDGSTAGWGVLALLDAEAAGATLPAWARTEVRDYYLTKGPGGVRNALNTDGSLKYQVYFGDNQSNFPKTGVGLQAMHFAGRAVGDPDFDNAVALLGTTWAAGFSTDGFTGFNKGLSYSMFNAFKGLKLGGVQTIAGVGRPAGPGSIPADDWHADYQDWLVANQMAPNTPAGGEWGLSWSCCDSTTIGGTAIAELILAPVALVLPANLTLAPLTATNPVGTDHTVTATATSASGSPVAGATVTFTVIAGPNAGATGTDVTDAAGLATFMYTSNGTAGTDVIEANIGDLVSNTVEKIWVSPNDPPVAVNDAFTTCFIGGTGTGSSKSDKSSKSAKSAKSTKSGKSGKSGKGGAPCAPLSGTVITNDSDPDGDPLTAHLVTGPGNGTLMLNPDGTFTYTPTAGFSGTDTFTYLVNDGSVDSNVATVTITVVKPVPPKSVKSVKSVKSSKSAKGKGAKGKSVKGAKAKGKSEKGKGKKA